VDERIAIIDTEALGRQRVVAAYLVRGKENALIDMGYRSSSEVVIRDLENEGLGPDDLDYLLPTHVHLDHAGSCGSLAKHFPHAVVRVHPVGEPHLVNPTRLFQGVKELFGEDLSSRYGFPEPINKQRVRSIGDDESVDLGGGAELRCVWTPGHASHHLSYAFDDARVMFTGDAVGVTYPDFPALVPTTPPPSFNLPKAIESINRVLELSPSQLCTPHFGILKDAKAKLAENVRTLLDWKAMFDSFIAGKYTLEEMTKILTEKACKQIGRPTGDVPDHLRVLIHVDVLGFIRHMTRPKPSESR
jgi:glyoxylase-like metal-dependent hydrolase (beta-lactamase superfamily II)